MPSWRAAAARRVGSRAATVTGLACPRARQVARRVSRVSWHVSLPPAMQVRRSRHGHAVALDVERERVVDGAACQLRHQAQADRAAAPACGLVAQVAADCRGRGLRAVGHGGLEKFQGSQARGLAGARRAVKRGQRGQVDRHARAYALEPFNLEQVKHRLKSWLLR